MKLLLDANLSWRLEKKLTEDFAEVFRVDSCGLPIPATDISIWNWAKDHDAVIVTNDEDFMRFTLQKGFPPNVVLLRIGNQSTSGVAATIKIKKEDIERLYRSQEYGILEIF